MAEAKVDTKRPTPAPSTAATTNVDDLIKSGTVIRNRWIVLERIGKGGFGAVYECFDMCRRDVSAMKVENRSRRTQVLKMEVQVLRKMQGGTHVCQFVGCGRTDTVNYVVMSLTGTSLSELRRRQETRALSLATTMNVGKQCVEALSQLHKAGFLHRDVKPGNFTMGRSVPSDNHYYRTVFIIDFGLARQYVMPNGTLRPARDNAGFRGTVRYASPNAHRHLELGRHDDLWSLFYGIVELITGGLPWRRLSSKQGTMKAKLATKNEELLAGLPSQLHLFIQHIESLKYETRPKYDYLCNLLQDIQTTHKLPLNGPLDWEPVSAPDTAQDQNAAAIKTNQRVSGQSNTGMALETIPELDSDQERIVAITMEQIMGHPYKGKQLAQFCEADRINRDPPQPPTPPEKSLPIENNAAVPEAPKSQPTGILANQPPTEKIQKTQIDDDKVKRARSAGRLLSMIMNATKRHKTKKKQKQDED